MMLPLLMVRWHREMKSGDDSAVVAGERLPREGVLFDVLYWICET